MSDPGQSPYGQQPNPYGQQPNPYGQQPGGYPSAPYPGAPYGEQKKKSKAGLYVALGIIVAIIVFCGGIGGLIWYGVNQAGDAIDEGYNQPGGRDNPLEIEAGEAFEIDGIEFQEGWEIKNRQDYGDEITGLEAKNNKDDETSDSISVDIKFLEGDTILAEVNCYSGGDIGFGQSKTLRCSTSDEIPDDYETVTANNSY